MADLVFNVAKGAVNAYHDRVKNNDPANSALILVILKTAEADATLKTRADLAAVLANGSAEADFTSYVRKTLTDADISASAVVSNERRSDIADPVWSPAGGASNNSFVKLLVCYDPDTTGGTDSTIIPLVAVDFVGNTNGGPITATIDATGYFGAT